VGYGEPDPLSAGFGSRLADFLRRNGPLGATRKVSRHAIASALAQFGIHADPVDHRRTEVSRRLVRTFGKRVLHGPFAGLVLDESESWTSGDFAAMMFGLYEQEVLNHLKERFARRQTFVNLGAADGYFAIGALLAGFADRAICFEMSDAGRRQIRRNAALNGVSDRVRVLGKADADFVDFLGIDDFRHATFLIDIEGAEFSLLTAEVLARLDQAQILFESHEAQDDAGAAQLTALLAEANVRFDVTELTTGARNPSEFPELRLLSDNDRWLLCSEGRPHLMRWYALAPKFPAHATGLGSRSARSQTLPH
jgi:Met-10+ like-protein